MIVFIVALALVTVMLISKRNVLYLGPGFNVAPTKEESPLIFWGTIIKAIIIGGIFLFDYLFGLL
jgi:hypothetical protein